MRFSHSLAPPLKRIDRPLGRLSQICRNPLQSGLPSGLQQVPDFREQFLLGRWPRSSRRWSLEPVYLFNDEEKAKSDNQKFNECIDEHSVGKNGDALVGSL